MTYRLTECGRYINKSVSHISHYLVIGSIETAYDTGDGVWVNGEAKYWNLEDYKVQNMTFPVSK